MKKLIFSICWLIFITSCSSDLEPRRTFYKNGSIKSLHYEDSEGEMQGLFTSYFKNGQISSTNDFINGKANGIFKSYHENRKIKSIMKIKNNIFHGYSFFYYKSGIIESKILLDNEKKMIGTFFYPNGKVERKASWGKYGGIENLPNCEIYFDKKGKIVHDPKHYKKSYYAVVNYGENNKTLKVKLFGFISDSIVVKYKRSFKNEDESFIRKIDVPNAKVKELVFDIQPSDYYKGRLNILIEVYHKETMPELLHLPPIRKEMCIQLDKGEKPAKYNLDPIW